MHPGKQRIDSHGIICVAITGAAMISGTNELHNSIRFVLGMAFANNIANAAEQGGGFSNCRDVALSECLLASYSRVYVSLITNSLPRWMQFHAMFKTTC